MKTYPFWRNLESSIEASKRKINNLLGMLGRKKDSAKFKKIVIKSNQTGFDVLVKNAGQLPFEIESVLDSEYTPALNNTVEWEIKVETEDGLTAYSKFGIEWRLIQ